MLSERSTVDPLLFLIDVDNTLLDNDRFAVDLGERLEHAFGADQRKRYWDLFEALRAQSGIADYLGALQQFRSGLEDDPQLLQMSRFLLEFGFADLLFPRALAVLHHLRNLAAVVVLSDGDVVFQPRKIQHAGIWDAVEGAVLVYVHKEQMLDHVMAHHPASHYVMLDDKPHILAAMKRKMAERLTTVFVRQGQYAHASGSESLRPAPDRVIERIGDILSLKLSYFEVRT